MTQDTRRDRHDESINSREALFAPLDTSAVLLETSSGGGSNSRTAHQPESIITTVGSVGAAVVAGQERGNSSLPTAADDSALSVAEPVLAGQQPQMKAPHISTLYKKKDVMAKHFGVTQKQALRTQALLRLGVTDEDVRIAERLMGPRSAGDNVSTELLLFVCVWTSVYYNTNDSYKFFFVVFGVVGQGRRLLDL